MDRRLFLQTTGKACLATTAVSLLLQRCSNVQYVQAVLSDKHLIVKKSDFIITKKKKSVRQNFVLVKHAQLEFPISIYEVAADEYHALYMQCTHQGCEVNAYTTQLICPCHGSEFSTSGKVLNGPAEKDLVKFKVTTDSDHIYINLA